MLAVGTILVVLFSDPMTDVLDEIGTRTGINSFYVSFVLAPMASNASELIASYSYAAKKTRKSISIAIQALQGAACMNNTFCLAIFMALIYFQGLAWQFTAETISILVAQILVALVSFKDMQYKHDIFFILLIYPFCIFIVAGLEGLGFD
jgi:Ca2+/Na+ antiporter